MSIGTSIMRFGNKMITTLGHHGPTIAVIGGSAAVIAGCVLACKATLKAEDILDTHNVRMNMVREAKAKHPNEYTSSDEKKDKLQVYMTTAGSFARLYGPSLLIGAAGFAAIFAGFGLIKRRYGIAVSAVTALDKSFKEYRKQVINEFGIEADERFTKNRGEFVEVDRVAVNDTEDEDGEPKTEKVEAIPLDDIVEDDFTRIFDYRNPKWENSAWLFNDNLIHQLEAWYTRYLQAHAFDHVFLNSVLKDLGFEETGIGHFYGWTDKPGCYVSFNAIPFIKIWDGDDDKQIPMMIPVNSEDDYDDFREAFRKDPTSVGYLLKFNVDTDENGIPCEIYHKVYKR